MIYRLKNKIQPYAWGSKALLTELFNMSNPHNKPQAELWMGTHPKGCSVVIRENDEITLDKFIAENPQKILGKKVYQKFSCLPYLFKILAVAEPLSIQVHPNKADAEAGFLRENQLGKSLLANNRNYKDNNHKPEMIVAITPFRAMNGFRPLEQIIELFSTIDIKALEVEFLKFKKNVNEKSLENFFSYLLRLDDREKEIAVEELLINTKKATNNKLAQVAFKLVQECAILYPNDIGLFAPLLLNIIELKVGQAMFLPARTPHAYLQGCGAEIMANSDNVLRAGLTPKHIDVEELLNNLDYVCKDVNFVQSTIIDGCREVFNVLVDDFLLEKIKLTNSLNNLQLECDSFEILFCLSGNIIVQYEETIQRLFSGQSVMVSANIKCYTMSGQGEVIRANCNI